MCVWGVGGWVSVCMCMGVGRWVSVCMCMGVGRWVSVCMCMGCMCIGVLVGIHNIMLN